MLDFLLALLAAVRAFFRSRTNASLEVLALRQQVAMLKRQRPRPTLTRLDRFFWTTLRHLSAMVGGAGLRGSCFVSSEHPVVLAQLAKTGAKQGTKRATSPGCSEAVPVSC